MFWSSQLLLFFLYMYIVVVDQNSGEHWGRGEVEGKLELEYVLECTVSETERDLD